MARLIEDLLDLTRVRCGTLTLRRELVDLRAVFIKAVQMVQPLVESRTQHLEVAKLAEPLWVSGDPSRLLQVVSNMLTNAAKFTPEGGRIWLSAAREGDTVTVRIRDNGAGIPKEMLSRVFELFGRVDPAGGSGSEGLGIGLSWVRQLVKLHGGSVEAISYGSNTGSEFVVRLPLSNGSDTDLSLPTAGS